MNRRLLLALGLPLLVLGTSPARGAADRCNPEVLVSANETLQISVADAPADLVLQARTARPLGLNVGLPRVNGNSLAEDFAVAAPGLDYGALEGDIARISSTQTDASVLASAGDRRFRLRLSQGEPRDGKGNTLRVRPAFFPAKPMVVKKGATVTLAPDGKWTVSPGATLEWVATAAEPLRVVLSDAAMLAEAAPLAPNASLDLASGRISPGATVPLQVRGAGPTLDRAAYRLCLSGANGRSVDLGTKRLANENDSTSLTAALPDTLIDRLSSAPTPWQYLWGEPVRMRLLAWSDGHPALELHETVLLTRPLVGAAFGLLVLVVVYLFAALFAGVFQPLTLFGQLIKHGKTGRYSLTSFQTLSWTLLVIFALCYSWYCSGVLLELRPDVLQLLGIVGGAHVLTRAVESANPTTAGNTPPAPTNPPAPAAEPKDSKQAARKVDLVTDAETGEFDILRFQMLAFTLFSLCYVAFNVLRSHGMPELPQSLYWLMGLGNIAHVAGKVPDAITAGARAPIPTASLSAFEAQLGADRIKAMQAALGMDQTGVLDAATRDAVVKYMAANGLYPVGQVSEPLLKRLGVVAG